MSRTPTGSTATLPTTSCGGARLERSLAATTRSIRSTLGCLPRRASGRVEARVAARVTRSNTLGWSPRAWRSPTCGGQRAQGWWRGVPAVDEHDGSVVVDGQTIVLRTIGRDDLRDLIESAWAYRASTTAVTAHRRARARWAKQTAISFADIRQVILALPGAVEGPIWGNDPGFSSALRRSRASLASARPKPCVPATSCRPTMKARW
jgi:hypothetical protein